MTQFLRVSALAALLLASASSIAAAQQWGQPKPPATGACFYEDINFGGAYFCTTVNQASTQVNYRMNNRISSIRLFGNAEVTVYQDYNFAGRSRTFESDVEDLRRGGWNDRITSYRVMPVRRGPGQGRGPGSYSPDVVTGRLEWRGRVDDRIHLAIRGRSVEHRTLSGTAMPDGNAIFTSGLPTQAVRVAVEKLSGRGTVRVLQQPARSNDFTAVIEIVDQNGGAQEYRIEVTWR